MKKDIHRLHRLRGQGRDTPDASRLTPSALRRTPASSAASNALCVVTFGVLGVFVSCLLLAGCPSEQPAQVVRLSAPDWQDGEYSVYDVVRRDSVLYRNRMRLRFSEEAPGSQDRDPVPGTLSSIPTLELSTSVRPVESEEHFADSSLVVIARDDLRPLRSYHTIETAISSFTIQAVYEPGKVTITRQSLDGTRVIELPTPPNTYDNEMVPFLLRALPLIPSAKLDFNIVVPLEERILPLTAQVLGAEFVATELGEIMCRGVSLKQPNRQVRLFYELAEPHRLVGLSSETGETEMRLVRYSSAEEDETTDSSQ